MRGVPLDFNIFKGMRELIAPAAAVAVNAAMGASPVYIHSVMSATPGKQPFRIRKMHIGHHPVTTVPAAFSLQI